MNESIVSSNPGTYQRVCVANIDADGRPDVLTFNAAATRIEWCRNEGGTPVTWTNFTVVVTGSGAQSALAAGDVSGDGRVDVVTSMYGSYPLRNSIVWLKNEGGSPPAWTLYTIEAFASSNSDNMPNCLVIGDPDGNGVNDVAAASNNGIVLYINDGMSQPSWTVVVLSTSASSSVQFNITLTRCSNTYSAMLFV
jgi:hypothetical protein